MPTQLLAGQDQTLFLGDTRKPFKRIPYRLILP
jgi:hypothetical protein